MTANYSDAAWACDQTIKYIDELSGGAVYTYDARVSAAEWKARKEPFITYLNSSGKAVDVHKALHVDQSTKNSVF